MKTTKFAVTGMTCSACSAHVEKSVAKLSGIKTVQVNLLTNSMKVTFDEAAIDPGQISSAVAQAGYGATPLGEKTPTDGQNISLAENELSEMKKRLIISFVFLLPLLYVAMGHMMNWPLPAGLLGMENALAFAFTQFLLCLPIAYVNRKYFLVGFKTLSKGAPNMDSLIAIGATAAIVYGIYAIYQIGYGLGQMNMDLVHQYGMDLYFESAATILTLITVGKYLETKSKGKTSQAISKLMDLAPKVATVERNGLEIEVPVEEVLVGDIVIVKPGQRVPVDGIITQGSTSIDESALTGESMPVSKKIEDRVIAATINKAGYFKFKALKVGSDTTLAQIIQLVEEASASKAPIAKLADKVSGVFVPVVMAIATFSTITWLILGYPFDFALSIGIAVLVISCPCALGLATPVAIMVGTGLGAEHGILIKSAEALEIAHTIDTVVLDKTGTITQGKPQVTTIAPTGSMTQDQLLALAASLEKSSEHPLADAIVSLAKERGLMRADANDFTALPGRGIQGLVNNQLYFAGNLKLMAEKKIFMGTLPALGDQLAKKGQTPLYFASEREALGLIAVADVIKPSSQTAIAQLKDMGLEVFMLTGDNAQTAQAIGAQIGGLSGIISDVLPQDKSMEIQRLQALGKKVAMIGDGINDAPALARANVGIAIGAGTDIAIESADIVLMKSDLLDAVTTIRLSHAVIKNIKQNLFWAFFYNSIGIPLAAGIFYILLGWKLNPMFAAAAMSLSSFCVVSNALRLKFFKPLAKTVQENPCPISIDQNSSSLEPELEQPIKGESQMTKTMIIEGMTCNHCSARVEKVLNALDGVRAQVDLDAKTATITLEKEIADDVLIKAVTDSDYTVVSLS